jgi:hypothetical protein
VSKKEAAYVKQPQAFYILLFWGNRELLLGNSYSNSWFWTFPFFGFIMMPLKTVNNSHLELTAPIPKAATSVFTLLVARLPKVFVWPFFYPHCQYINRLLNHTNIRL